jgi:hypothetical protein
MDGNPELKIELLNKLETVLESVVGVEVEYTAFEVVVAAVGMDATVEVTVSVGG